MVAVVEGALARKAQIGAADIGKIIALGVQKVAKAGRTGQEPVESRTRPDQRHAALAGHHSRNGPARLFHLGQVGKADCLAFQRLKVRHQPRKAGFVQIAAFHRLKVQQHEVPAWSGEFGAFDRHKSCGHRPQVCPGLASATFHQPPQIAHCRIDRQRPGKQGNPPQKPQPGISGQRRGPDQSVGHNTRPDRSQHPRACRCDKAGECPDPRAIQTGLQMIDDRGIDPRSGQPVDRGIGDQKR